MEQVRFERLNSRQNGSLDGDSATTSPTLEHSEPLILVLDIKSALEGHHSLADGNSEELIPETCPIRSISPLKTDRLGLPGQVREVNAVRSHRKRSRVRQDGGSGRGYLLPSREYIDDPIGRGGGSDERNCAPHQDDRADFAPESEGDIIPSDPQLSKKRLEVCRLDPSDLRQLR